jgi:hypothetical protein
LKKTLLAKPIAFLWPILTDDFVLIDPIAAPVMININRIVMILEFIGDIGDKWGSNLLDNFGFPLLFQDI